MAFRGLSRLLAPELALDSKARGHLAGVLTQLTDHLEACLNERMDGREARSAPPGPTTAAHPGPTARPGGPRPTGGGPPGEPRPLHQQIREVLASQPGGLTPVQIAAVLGTDRPLRHVLRGLWRRGRLTRLGPGRYALPQPEETRP